MVQPLWENLWKYLIKLNHTYKVTYLQTVLIKLSDNPHIPLLGIYPRESENMSGCM